MASPQLYKTITILVLLICLLVVEFETAFAASLEIELLRSPYKDVGSYCNEIRQIFRNLTTDDVLISRFPDLSYQKLFLVDETGVVYSEKHTQTPDRRKISDKVSIPPDLTFLPPPIIMEPKGRFEIKSMQNYFIISMINDPDEDDILFSNLYGYYLDKDFNICNGKDLILTDLPVAAQKALEKAVIGCLGQFNRCLNKEFQQYVPCSPNKGNIENGSEKSETQ